MEAEAALAEANVQFTGAQTKNTYDDNAKQLAVSIDKHFQEWADLQIKAVKEGAELPPRPEYTEVLMMAKQLLNNGGQLMAFFNFGADGTSTRTGQVNEPTTLEASATAANNVHIIANNTPSAVDVYWNTDALTGLTFLGSSITISWWNTYS